MIRLAEQPVEDDSSRLSDPIPTPVDLVFPAPVNDRVRIPRKIDFTALESQNSQRGRAGELLVLDRERRHLADHGRTDLAARVRHVSEEVGDGLGYDVLSFTPGGAERFLEVKTTVRSAHQPFFVSRNEVELSAEEPDRFSLVRVFRLGRGPGFYEMPGSLHDTADLVAESFLALPHAQAK